MATDRPRDEEPEGERWARAVDLFHAAAERPDGERTGFLDDACAGDAALRDQVLAMLAIDAQDHALLDHGVAPAAEAVLGADATVPSGQVFGPYRVTGLLGEGGMGVVYRAQRDDLESEAAIKVLRDAALSPARRARFAFEQRVLAQLNHPSIARLYDAGALPDGTPWIAMELVEGVPIHDYCRAHDLAIDARLRLFREACEAVQHAHGRAILHRDLKPSNILVRGDGRVKLLDFGISRPLAPAPEAADATRTGLRLMTPAYAAPEQVRGGPLGVHTDVYALGVVLYELLTGRLPFDLSGCTPSEAATLLTERPVRRPSLVAGERTGRRGERAGWGDLDVLCLTAMHRDPARRYRTVDALVRDLDRYLADQPLEARGDSFGYVAGKFLRRHAVAAGLTAAGVVLLAAVIVFYTSRLAASRDLARAEAARAQSGEQFVTRLFQGDDSETELTDTLRVVTLLRRGRIRTGGRLVEPLVQANFERTLGGLFEDLGDLESADSLVSSAYARTLAAPHPIDADVARSTLALSRLRADQERYEEAVTLARRGLEFARRGSEPGDPLVAEATGLLGQALERKGDYELALPVLREAVRLRSARGGDEAALAAAQTELANTYYYLGRYAEADTLNRRILVRDRRLYGDRDPNVASDLLNLGAIQSQLGHYGAAEQRYREALAISRAYHRDAHPFTADCLTNLARALVFQERFDEARPLLQEALAIQTGVLGAQHTAVAGALSAVADIDLSLGRYEAATHGYSRALAIYRRAYGAHHLAVGTTLGNLGSVAMKRGDPGGAERWFRAALDAYRGPLPPDHMDVAIMHIKLGRVLLRQRRYAEAETNTRRGYEVVAKQADPGISFLRAARTDLVEDYVALGRPKDAARFRAELADTAATR